MKLEDKLVDGLDAAKQESRQREDVEMRGEEALPAPVVEAMRDAALERRAQLLGAVRMVLDRETLTVASLRLPMRESLALEALQVATTGRSSDTGQFVYASDRRDLLERALGVLQPDLVHADAATAIELDAQFADLSARVADLRGTLTDLEDAQDELLTDEEKARLAAMASGDGGGDKADKPDSDPDAPRPPSTLDAGPDLAAQAAPPSTLSTGPDVPASKPPSSTLDAGPDLPAAPAPPSTLGDPADLAAAEARAPWWRRPFGGA
ncbi:MAG TPA: hypothetical protein VFP84_24005 [Kofleriaceae bacterium]|nr:hypothetical protein [Kofleriaceae bacterium]